MLLLKHFSPLGPLVEASQDCLLATGVDADLLAGRDALNAQSELGRSTTSRLRIQRQCLPLDVLQVITSQMVARILRSTSAGENTGRRDTELQEGDVVRVLAEAAVDC